MRLPERHETGKQRPAGSSLDHIVDPDHVLVKLAAAIDWRQLETHFDPTLINLPGSPTFSARLMAGLAMLKHIYGLSNETLCEQWAENPYYQYFCGEKVFRHGSPFDTASLTRRFERLDEAKLQPLLHESLPTVNLGQPLKPPDLPAGVRTDQKKATAKVATQATDPKSQGATHKALESQNGRNSSSETQKPISIYDVAKHAGVSIKTVSLVLNHRPNVSLKTRKNVLDSIGELSYRPNIFARGLASEGSFLIGLLYDNPSASYVADLQLGALARCREEGYHLIVELMDAQSVDLGQRVRSLVSESVLHGVILTPPLCDAQVVIDALTAAHARFVRIAPGNLLAGSPSISIDDRKAAYDMTAYLIGLGHRRIGFIKGHPDHRAALARLEGYRAALAHADIPFTEELCASGFFSYQSGLEAAEHLLSLKRRPTAIFAGNDDMAAAVLAVAQRFNLKIPQQLSLAGFDDSLVAQVVWPRLTTCRQPIKEMAAAAVSLLTQKPQDDLPPERHLKHELIVRKSTAPPES